MEPIVADDYVMFRGLHPELQTRSPLKAWLLYALPVFNLILFP